MPCSGSDGETVKSSKALKSVGKNRIRLNYAARNRFEYLIKQGLPADKASIETVEPVKKETISQPKMIMKVPERDRSASMLTKPTFSRVTEGLRMGILPNNYPKVLLTKEQMESEDNPG
ncbi:hypothetical protein JTB14_010246 [Gonioctena quinquepunctata]|nr:hypothetical protein JTB14_010246 [Gonioctena quinquepunctata]